MGDLCGEAPSSSRNAPRTSLGLGSFVFLGRCLGWLPAVCVCVCVCVCERVRECSRSATASASASARALMVGFVMMVGLLMAFGEGDLGLRSKTLINDVYDVMAFIKESVYVWDVAAVCFHTLSGPLILPPWVALLPPRS